MTQARLSALYLYPIKSLAGIKVTQWPVLARGLQYDRQWMIVDENHRFLSQRQLPRMGLITPRIENDLIVLSAQDKAEISIPLIKNKGDTISVEIWADQCDGVLVDSELDCWLSDFLGQTCHLVYQPESARRAVDQAYAQPDDQVYFSDGFPFLIISEASLKQLSQDCGLDLAMARFRPNLVIDGCDAYAEDYWRQIGIGNINFRLPKPCSRCAITTITPGTAAFAKEPLTTLNRTRKWRKKVYFGQNAIHDNSGILTRGDLLTVRKTGPAQPPID